MTIIAETLPKSQSSLTNSARESREIYHFLIAIKKALRLSVGAQEPFENLDRAGHGDADGVEQSRHFGDFRALGDLERGQLGVLGDGVQQTTDRAALGVADRQKPTLIAEDIVLEASSRGFGHAVLGEIGEQENEAQRAIRGRDDRVRSHHGWGRTVAERHDALVAAPRRLLVDQGVETGSRVFGVLEILRQVIEVAQEPGSAPSHSGKPALT